MPYLIPKPLCLIPVWTPTMIREIIFDIGKIVEGAADGDASKIVTYVNHMSSKLEASGESDAAARLRKIVAGGRVGKIGLAKAAGLPQPLPMPVDSESRLPVADESSHAKGSVDVFLPTEVRAAVDRFLTYYHAAGQLFARGVGISPTMIVYGPPGCGKTQLAKFIASETSLPLITARSDSLISSYLGSTAKNIRSLFAHAGSRPCVLFMDEFDSIAKMRDDNRELGELKRVVISLLQNIDAMREGSVLVAATNHEHLLDPAIWRRFACKIKLDEPTVAARVGMATAFLREFANPAAAEALVAVSSGMNGAQVRQLANDSMRNAVLSQRASVQLEDVAAAASDHHPPLSSRSDMPVGDRLRAIRAINPKYFTQSRLAEIVGISQPMVSKILRKAVGRDQ